MSKTLIIGLGTGRCGSLSLSYFLNNQPGIKVLHEGAINYQAHPLKWYNDHENVWKWIENLDKLSDSNQYFGDIGMYFLPYVAFLIEKFPRSKFICLKREREAVIHSYLQWTQDHNPWYEHNGKTWKKMKFGMLLFLNLTSLIRLKLWDYIGICTMKKLKS